RESVLARLGLLDAVFSGTAADVAAGAVLRAADRAAILGVNADVVREGGVLRAARAGLVVGAGLPDRCAGGAGAGDVVLGGRFRAAEAAAVAADEVDPAADAGLAEVAVAPLGVEVPAAYRTRTDRLGEAADAVGATETLGAGHAAARIDSLGPATA